jgi:NAD-dependent deacetylase
LKEDLIQKTAQAISRSNKVVAFTGAGISVESGIPDFRGAGGLWEKFDPAEYATIEAFRADPKKVWAMLKEMGNLLESSKPNAAHLALAALERLGHVRSVITQNIDHLHQDAGNTRVIEYHGSHKRLVCLSCGRQVGKEEVPLETLPPLCRCDGVLKPTVVFFGEPIPRGAHLEAMEEARNCEVMLVIGTSAVVSPACEIPILAKRAGAAVVEVNLEETQLTGSVSDWILKGSAGRILQSILDRVSSQNIPGE